MRPDLRGEKVMPTSYVVPTSEAWWPEVASKLTSIFDVRLAWGPNSVLAAVAEEEKSEQRGATRIMHIWQRPAQHSLDSTLMEPDMQRWISKPPKILSPRGMGHDHGREA